ncbi:MAG: Kelch repeat-containing protein, partial [Rhodothermales bacterium]
HTGSMATTRVSHTATLLPNGTVLIAGGIKSDERTRAEVYDPATGAFSPTGRMLEKRYGHTATLLRNGNVLIVGGLGPEWTYLGSAEIYDPATGTFTTTGSMTTPRASHTATLLDDGKVLITGGHRGRRSSQQLFSSAEVYDPATGTFASTGSMNVIRHKHEAVRLQNGHVLVLGGSNEKDGRSRYKSAEVYNPRSGTFTLTGEMPSARFKIKGTAVLMPDGTVLVAGGAARADLYDPASRSFSQVPGTLETALLFSTATLLANGTVLITGGYDHTITSHASAWVYRP